MRYGNSGACPIPGPEMKKGRLEADLFRKHLVPEDSVTRARPRLRLQAQPFESSCKARRRFASWAEMKKGRQKPTFL